MFQALESRRLYSVTVQGSVLVVDGTSAGENMYAAWKTTSTGFTVRINDGTSVNDYPWTSSSPWTSVVFNAKNGNDTINGAAYIADFTTTYVAQRPLTLNGEAGTDLVQGSRANDVLTGGSSSDTITGNQGDDILIGGEGNDSLVGEAGFDDLYGETGNDILQGGSGNDYLEGGAGYDQMDGGVDNDVIYAIDGEDDDIFFSASSGGTDLNYRDAAPLDTINIYA